MLRRIKLIVTGDVERDALVDSLRRWFPDRIDKIAVEWLAPRKVHCTTSNPLSAPTRPLPSQMEKLARAMVAEAWEGSDGHPADLVVAVDDLELANQHQPATVVEHIKAAIQVEIERRRPKLLSDVELSELRQRIQDRCSFHLLAPMIESYFFTDRATLTRAKVPPTTHPRLRHPDVEDFETIDPDWLPACAEKNAAMALDGHPWWRQERHPKHYLEHLTPPTAPYMEIPDGIEALKQLDWPRVSVNSAAAPFARALFEDLSEWFGIDNPLGPGACAPETSPVLLRDRRNLLLRNL